MYYRVLHKACTCKDNGYLRIKTREKRHRESTKSTNKDSLNREGLPRTLVDLLASIWFLLDVFPQMENLSIEQGDQEDQGYPLKLKNYLWYRNLLFFRFFCRIVLLSGVWSGFLPCRSVPFIDSISRSPERSKVTDFFRFLTDVLQRLSFLSSWPPSSSNLGLFPQTFFSSVFDFFSFSVPQLFISCMIVGFTVHCNLVFHDSKNLLVVCALRVVISTGCRQNQVLVDSSCDHDQDAVLLEQLVFLYPNFLDSYDFDQCYLFSHRQTWQQQTSAEDFVFWCAIHGFWFLHHYLKRKYPFCFVSYRKIHCGGFLTLTLFRFLCTNVEDGCKEESCSSSNSREVLFRKELINPLTSRND